MKARHTVLGLMGVIVCVGVGLAAVRSNDEFSAAAIFALTFSVLCTSTLIAIYRRGAWAGFAVFGWAQFWICQPHTAPTLGPTSLSTGIAYRVLTRFHNTAPEINPPKLATAEAVGGTVALAWLVLALTRKWNAEPGWIDRAGRLIGATAIAACAQAGDFDAP